VRPLPSPTFALAFALASLAAQSPPPAELAARVDSLCQPLIDAELAVGFVVGVVDGDATFVRGYGVLARDRTAAPDGDTVYEIGSISKVFTGLLLADAVRRGEVALDDPVQKHLPEGMSMPNWRGGTPVLLWHLSTHTSGLPRLPDMKDSDPADPYAHFTGEVLADALADARVQREPGSAYEYSNLGVGVLGLALAHASGAASYEELLAERIARPLGMPSTRVVLDDAMRARLAPPHDGGGEPAHAWDLASLAGAGGIRSTVRDMLTFARAQLAGASTALGAAIPQSQEKRHDGARGIAMTLGWHVARDGVSLVHNGQTGGCHGFLGVQPAHGRAVCILTNTAAGEIDAIGEKILQHLHGQPVEPLAIERPAAVDHAVLARCPGTYRMAPGVEIEVTLRERGLYAQLTGQAAHRIWPRSPTEFFYRVVEASITFQVEGETVTGLVLHQNGRDMKCRRVEAASASKESAK
jgi:CubicO group peptidase (beta-lactamase class C family)